jgi:hypothetical protein
MSSATTVGEEVHFDDGLSERGSLISDDHRRSYGSVPSTAATTPHRPSHHLERVPTTDAAVHDSVPVTVPAVAKTEEDVAVDKKRRWLIFHICVLAFLDMTAYAMCLVPFTALLEKLSINQGGSGSTSEKQTYQTICVVLTSIFAFAGGPVIGGLSDSFGRFPAVLFTRLFRICFALCLVFVDRFNAVKGIDALLFVGYSIQGLCDPDMCIAIFYAMIADTFSAKARTFYFGLVSSVFAAPIIIGPFIGVWIQVSEWEGEWHRGACG